jgi:hypothetical protein
MLGRTVYRAAFKLLSHWDRTAIDCAKSLETLGMCALKTAARASAT